ncbi:MAG: FISUMP domain-containing protein [Bacteroidales bacterium]
MKKITFLFLMIFANANIYSQIYTISFAATGAATTVDSVKVENITQGTTVKWYAGDVLQLILSNGINNLGANEENFHVFPNPMQGQAEILFYVKQSGNATLSIYNISGKEIVLVNNKFSQGIQKFQLKGLKQGVYFINIRGENYLYTSKLISLSTMQCEVKIVNLNLGGSKVENNDQHLKSTNTTVDMPYTSGDRLLFKGISSNYSTIVADIPTSSKTIHFNFTECTDADNNNYPIVQIGTQTWMAENLRTSKYRNLNPINYITDTSAWALSTTGAYCWYNNDSSNYDIIWGKLYNWYAVVDTQKICPVGWHFPKDAEWITLTNYLGTEPVAGGKLKETGTQHWQIPNVGATNETGYTALPGGNRNSNGSFDSKEEYGYWWSSTESNATFAKCRLMYYGYSDVNGGNNNKQNGLSARCVYGDLPTLTSDSVTNIATNTATCGGNIISDGGSPIISRGICWGNSPNPTITANSYTSNCTGTNTFSCGLIGLNYNETYYVRAYATNSAGTSYGAQMSFITISPFAIGQTFGGGIIFYIDWTGLHGLISSTSDQAISAVWGCYGTLTGASSLLVGAGQTNTAAIINICSQPGIAAKICDSLVLNGYNDWFLPSIGALSAMYDKSNFIGGFDYTARYWSSTEYNNNQAWYRPFYSGFTAHYSDKTDIYRVRAIRAF